MSFEADEEILQDFLVEAGEIIELLSEQLVDLEQRPDDTDLLNAIFRGFHTVKGGAGFLQLTPLVDCCHVAENIFDILRNGKRKVTSDLMDVVLEALDAVHSMFNDVRAGVALQPADPELIRNLQKLALPEDEKVQDIEQASEEQSEETLVDDVEPTSANSEDNSDITDDEFEQLLNALDEEKAEAEAQSAGSAGDDEITDDEFEALLDELHGKGKHSGVLDDAEEPSETDHSSGQDDLISDSEFEELLDRLHGKGKHSAADEADAAATAPEKPKAAAASKDSAAKATPAAKKPEPKPKAAAPVAEKEAMETTVRVDTKRLDDIMNMVGELVLVRNRLVRLGLTSNDEAITKAVANLDVVTGDIQSSVMKTRMQPIKKVFGRFPRVVRDMARQLKKEITLELRGEETDLDKNLVEALADPLVHLVRNSVDHGVEMPDVREQRGKPRVGTIVLSAEQEGDHILLTIRDDGNGMDANILRRKAVEKGVMEQDAADRLTDNECYNLIFAPGFSTKEEVSDVSGRGVGMDVVKTKITQLNGSVSVDSQIGVGTVIRIKVPLTLAIMPTLMVMIKNQAFAFPLVSVNEIFHLDLTKTNIVDGQEVIVVRERAIPLFYLKRWLIKGTAEKTADETAHVVVVSVGTQRVGFVVDQLVGQEEVVIKPLGKMLHGTPGMAGATITGDGRIALILDIPSMLTKYAKRLIKAA